MSGHSNFTALRAASLAVLTLTTITGCGGGGGGSNADPAPAEYLAITSANAPDVASIVIQTVGSALAVADPGGGVIAGTSAPAAASSRVLARHFPLLPQLRRQAQGGREGVGPLASVGPITDPCLVSGSVSLSGNLADPERLSVGDRITAVSNDCDDGDGAVTDGRLELLVRALQGDPDTDAFLIRADTELTRFVVTEDGESTTANGAFDLTLDSLAFPAISTRIVGDSLELASGGDTFTLTNFDEMIDTTGSDLPYQDLVTAAGTLASRLLAGKVDYDTTMPVEGPAGDAPESGEILITGANGATIRVVVQGQASVDLEIDLDGNGTVDEVQATTWAELGGDVAPGVTVGNAAAVAREALAATSQFELVVRDAGAQFGLSEAAFRSATNNVSVAGPFGPVAPRCQLSNGSASVTGQLAVPGTFTIGDQFDGTFVGCGQTTAIGQFPGSTSLNGVLATVVTDSLSSPFIAVSFDGEARDFKSANGQFTGNYNGDPITGSWSGTSPSIQLEDTFFGALRALVDASVNTINDTFFSPARITRTVTGVVYTALIPGRYTVETLTPLVSNGDFDFATGPYAGEVKVTADNGSSVRVVAVNDLNARLDLDLDGNGSTDQSITVPWQQLR